MILESSMAGGRREVAVAAMQLLVAVTQAHGDSKCMQRSMWKRALRATGVGVEAAASPQCMVPLQARLELVVTISQLHVSPPLPSTKGSAASHLPSHAVSSPSRPVVLPAFYAFLVVAGSNA